MNQRQHENHDGFGLRPDERRPHRSRLEVKAAPETSQVPESEPEITIPKWTRPGLTDEIRARMRGPFTFKLQKKGTTISVANPAWGDHPEEDACRIADYLANGWNWVKGRGPHDRRF